MIHSWKNDTEQVRAFALAVLKYEEEYHEEKDKLASAAYHDGCI